MPSFRNLYCYEPKSKVHTSNMICHSATGTHYEIDVICVCIFVLVCKNSVNGVWMTMLRFYLIMNNARDI